MPSSPREAAGRKLNVVNSQEQPPPRCPLRPQRLRVLPTRLFVVLRALDSFCLIDKKYAGDSIPMIYGEQLFGKIPADSCQIQKPSFNFSDVWNGASEQPGFCVISCARFRSRLR